MKIPRSISFLTTILMIIALQGCDIYCLHPLYTDDDIVFIPELIGQWKLSSDDDTIFKFDRHNKDNYHLQITDNGDTVNFALYLLKLGKYYYMDYYPMDCGNVMSGTGNCNIFENMLRNFIPVHTFSRIDMTEAGFSIVDFDKERLSKLFMQNRIRLNHEKMSEIDDDMIVITAQTKDIQKFIIKYSDDEDVFEAPDDLIKISG